MEKNSEKINKEIERINKKLQNVFEDSKKKYKNESPNLSFIIKDTGTHESIGVINNDTGEMNVIQTKYSLIDKWIKGTFNFELTLKFDKKIKQMKDLKSCIGEAFNS